MAINKWMMAALKALSYPDIDLKSTTSWLEPSVTIQNCSWVSLSAAVGIM